jgi:hypothetical protein
VLRRRDQSISEIQVVASQQITVPSTPLSTPQVMPETGQAIIGISQFAERRNRPANRWHQVRVRTPPICTQESVGAVVRNVDGLDVNAAKF